MNTKFLHATDTPDLLFIIAIVAIAVGLGLYGFYIILTLTRANGNESRGFQNERLMLGMFNILLSLFAIYTVALIMQVNAGELFSQSNKLLSQLK